MATATHVGPILVSGLGIQGPATTQTALPSTLLLVNNAGTGYITGCGPSPGVNGEILFQTDTSNGANPQRVLALEGDGDGIFYNNLTVQGILTALTKLDVDGDAQFNANVGVTGALEAQRGDYTSLFVQGSRVLTEAELPPDAIPYPPPGVSVSTGTAWSPSINPADLPRLSTPNTFTAAQTINGAITVAGGANLNGGVASGIYYLNSITPSATWNSDGGTTFIDCGGTGRLLLNYNHNPGGVGFGNNGAGGPVVMFDPAGNAVFNGTVTAANGHALIDSVGDIYGASLVLNAPAPTQGSDTVSLSYNPATHTATLYAQSLDSTNSARINLVGVIQGSARGVNYLSCRETAGANSARVSISNSLEILDNNLVQKAIIDNTGTATFAGNVTMGSFFQVTGSAGGSTTKIFGAGNTTYIDSLGGSPSASSAFLFRTIHGDDSNVVNVLSIDSVEMLLSANS